MADVVDQTISNPQPLVDAALGVTSEVKPPLPPLEPVSQSIPPDITTNPPITSTTPEVKVGDETPLAFMTPTTPPAQSGVIPNNPIISQNQNFPEEQKQKKGKGKVVGLVVGLFLLLAGLGGGFYFYINYLPPKPSTISNIQTQYPTKESCVGVCNNNRLLRWDAKNARCEDSGKSCDADTSTEASGITRDKCVGGNLAWCDGCGGYCMRFTTGGFGCHQMSAAKCGEYPQLGGNIVACDSPQALTNCDDKCGKCFDSRGLCEHTASNGVEDGLCAIVPMASANTTGVTNYYYCPGKFTDLFGGCSIPGKPSNPSCYCGTVQIDGPSGFTSQTMKCGCEGEKSPQPSASTEYSMSCTGITKNVASPVVGSKITFTCAGATVPAVGETLLKYNFRYSLDSGAWKALTNKTNTTTELTVAACGSYNVQCRACVTYGGKTQCDPIWQGATQ